MNAPRNDVLTVPSAGSIKRPVLILGIEPRVTLAIARSLHRRGVPVHVADMKLESAPPLDSLGSRAVRHSLRFPDGLREPEAFRDALLEHVRAHRIDMLIPCGDTFLQAVGAVYADLVPHLIVACPPPPVLRRVLDKRLTLEIARDCGIPVPLTVKCASAFDASVRYPLVAKPADKEDDELPFKVRYFEDRDALRRALEEHPKIASHALLQEYCPGVGVGIGTLMHDGEPLAMVQHRRLKELPATGGVSVVAISEPVDPDLGEATRALLRRLEWRGPAMVEFRQDPATGDTRLMEVNGRYWGTLPVAIHAGIDFPYIEWALAHGEKPEIPDAARTGIRVRWTRGAVERLGERLGEAARSPDAWRRRAREFLDFLGDFGLGTRDAIFDRSDLRPAVGELNFTLRWLKRSARRTVAKRLPPSVRRWRTARYGLERRASLVYLTLGLLRDLGLRRDGRRRTPREARSVVFVCLGNIIRSAGAAAFFARAAGKSGLDGFEVDSAGLGAQEGRPADPRAIIAGRELGVCLDDHRARRLTSQAVASADAIYVMDYRNEAALLGRHPGAFRKVFLLGAWQLDEATGGLEIQDPVHDKLDDVRRCQRRIEAAVNSLVEELAAPKAVSRG